MSSTIANVGFVPKLGEKQLNNKKNQITSKSLKQNILHSNVKLAELNSNNLKAYYLNNSSSLKSATKSNLNVAFGSKIDTFSQLGAQYDPKTDKYNFGLRSEHAEKVRLCIFDGELGKEVMHFDSETKDKNHIFKFELPLEELKKANAVNGENKSIYYGYRVWGPNWKFDENWKPGKIDGFVCDVDDKGNRFNPNKLLVDPYAREISHDPISPEKVKVQDPAFYYKSGADHRLNDSAPIAPKSMAFVSKTFEDLLKNVSPEELKTINKTRERAFDKEVVYETHLRGLTKRDMNIPKELRGTYAGAALKAKDLADLGVTAVEFLPVQEAQNDANDKNIVSNYWGYLTLGFFAPERRYAADKTAGGPTEEYMKMVLEFNKKGIKVINDVVYNHSGEQGLCSSDPDTTDLFSMRGIDNESYYETSDNGKRYQDNTGCGANHNVAHPNGIFRDLTLDSLKYWKNSLGTNGFRFDLAPVLGNEKSKDNFQFNRDKPDNILNRAKREIGRPAGGGKGVDLIAEPWGCGDGTYQLGNFPKGWSEWNDKFRDTMRKVENRCDDVTPGEIAHAVAGSDRIFSQKGPVATVNFIDAHDGFTMKDLHSYDQKNNRGSDGGSDNNTSWNHFGNPNLQRQGVRNSFVDLMTSAGVPMFVGGDESLRSVDGNNNPYNLDTAQNYLYWGWKTPKNLQDNIMNDHNKFVKTLIQFRKDHPSIAPTAFYSGKDENHNGLPDISWYNASGSTPTIDYWDNPKNHFLAFRTDCTEVKFGKPESPEAQKHKSVYVAINKSPEGTIVTIPEPVEGKNWYIACDTSQEQEGENIHAAGEEILLKRSPQGAYEYDMKGRTRLVLVEK